MVIIEFDRIELDNCLTCGGVWLDSGELYLLLDKPGDRSKYNFQLKNAIATKEKLIRCPRCFKKMAKAWIDGGNSVPVDLCGNGHGLWLDSGELAKVLMTPDVEIDGRIKRLLAGIFKKAKSDLKGE
jgi:Zn-finger nucleic acid-binding protein